MEYIYNQQTNDVTAIINSDEILANTKPTWKLSEDKLSYSKVYNANSKYYTQVQDIWGNTSNVEINVKDIDDKSPVITIDYNYNSETNEVVVTLNSNEVLGNTKPTWTLSEDKLSYSKIYNANSKYYTQVQDIYGNTSNVEINVKDIDDKAPIISVEYNYNLKNNEITVSMHSNEKLGNTKPTWTLSEDKLNYAKTYKDSEIQDYSTLVKDIYGNECWIRIKINTKQYTYNNENGLNVVVKYLYDSSDIVTVYIVSNKILNDTKPTWTLDSTKTIYTKKFNKNESYVTTLQDIDGNVANISIIIDFYKNTFKGIDVSEYQKIINWSAVKKSGIDFAIIRVAYRGWGSGAIIKDRFFDDNIKEATKVRNEYRNLFL